MARTIVVSIEDATSTFDFSKVDRTKLYGRRTRLFLDPDGNSCSRAALTQDGSLVLRSGMTGYGYFDEAGFWIPNNELVGLNQSNEPVEKIPSTLGVAQNAVEADPAELLTCRMISVYQLDPAADAVDDALMAKLQAGSIYRIPFNYRTDYAAEHAWLLANEEGLFAIVGHPVEPSWCELDQPLAPVFDDDDDDDDDLDFEMF